MPKLVDGARFTRIPQASETPQRRWRQSAVSGREGVYSGGEKTVVKRKSLADSPCPVARALDIIGDRWSLLIVRDGLADIRRFGDFQKSLGVARNILADRLRMLVDNGIFEIAPASDGTAYQEYVLTPAGRTLFPVIVGLRQWGEKHLYVRGEAHSLLIDVKSGRPVQKMEVKGRDGRRLRPSDTIVKRLPAKSR